MEKGGSDYCFNRFASFVKKQMKLIFVDVGGGVQSSPFQIAK
jgi:hypothetical protein